MNFLAHVYLSNGHAEITIGNFIADFVKGNNYKSYSEGIQNGILLHRKIDHFTDTHPVFIKSKIRLRKDFGKYAGVIGDVFYDHFLALHWSKYHPTQLDIFANQIYDLMQNNWEDIPERLKEFFPYMKKENWLYQYGTIDGIRKTLEGISRKTLNNAPLYLAMGELTTNYTFYEDEFLQFFPEVRKYSFEYLENLDM